MKKNYSVSEAAKRLGYSKNSVYSFLKEGLIGSSRIGNGKFRIPENELLKFEEGKNDEKIKAVKKPTESVTSKTSEPMVLESALLPLPRPGKSLSEIGGEPFLHTLKLWLEERVGIPTTFDWLISMTSIILGLSLFLYSSQVDILSEGRLSLWLNSVRLGMILGGMGLILASMVQEEMGKLVNITNIFRYLLGVIFAGLSVVLLFGGDIDGFFIYGLFGLLILVEAISGIQSTTLYMIYIFGLMTSIFVVYHFFDGGAGYSVVATGLRSLLGSFSWVLSAFVFVLVILGVYGFVWNKRFLKAMTLIYGIFLCLLALFYGIGNYWCRSFAVLVSGIVGLVMPYLEIHKTQFMKDRTLVFRMFGSMLGGFVLFIALIAVVQGALINSVKQDLADKAEFAGVEISRTIDSLKQGVNDLSKSDDFISAFAGNRNEEMLGQIKYLFLGRNDVALVAVVNAKGKLAAVYPQSNLFGTLEFSQADFYTTSFDKGKTYISSKLEKFTDGVENVILVSVPVTNSKNVVSGVLVAAISGVNFSSEVQRVARSQQDQQVVVVSSDGRVVIHPETDRLGSLVSEADSVFDIWKSKISAIEGYDWRGIHTMFAAKELTKYGLMTVVSEPVQKSLDISSSWLTWVLFLVLIVGVAMLIPYFYLKEEKEER